MSLRARARVRAPELRGAGWLNTGGRELTLATLRGRIVLLDFWTSACANCLHVLDELRPLEARYADVLVTIGVHSPKFPHEAEDAAVAAAVERYAVLHPVLHDPDLETWRQYAVTAWPTLVLVDPQGYVAATAEGEGHVAALGEVIEALADEFAGILRRGGDPYVPPPRADTPLRYPGGIALTPSGTFLVADAGHHSLLELAADGQTVLRRIGSGERGRADGHPHEASFAEPQGLAILPERTAGADVVVADTANHLLRGVRLDTGEVSTLADLPVAVASLETVTGPVPSVLSPWDVTWWDGRLAVAAAGVHLLLTVDPQTGAAAIAAGTTVEGLRDGPALDGWLAQPSGLAADGATLWFVDAETSALRTLTAGGKETPGATAAGAPAAGVPAAGVAAAGVPAAGVPAAGVLRTAVGAGLFDFGLVDGPAAFARFQHPLGVTLLPDGTVAVLDTYNGAVRRYDPRTGTVDTVVTGLAEPTGAVVVGSSEPLGGDGRRNEPDSRDPAELVVVESAAHRLTRIPLAGTAEIGPGAVTVEVTWTPPPGQRADHRYGPATSLRITGLPGGQDAGPDLTRRLEVEVGTRLRVSAYAASCAEAEEHPACHLTRRDWDVRVVEGGPPRVRFNLDGDR